MSTARTVFGKFAQVFGGKLSAYTFIVSIAAFLASLKLTIDDHFSTIKGVQGLEAAYNINIGDDTLSYLAIALFTDTAQTVLSYIIFANKVGHRDKDGKWHWSRLALLIVAIVIMFAADFGFDIYHRAKGILAWDQRTMLTAGATLLYFTLGSNVLMPLAFGVSAEIAGEAWGHYQSAYRAVLGGRGPKNHNRTPPLDHGKPPQNYNRQPPKNNSRKQPPKTKYNKNLQDLIDG